MWTMTETDKILDLLLGLDCAVCQRCIEGAIALPEAIVTLRLITLGENGRLRGQRGRCTVCRAAAVVFRVAK